MTKPNGSIDPYEDPTSIGNLAIQKGWATPEDVRDALKKQEARTPLGELLVEAKVLSRDQLEDLLFEQELARKNAKPTLETKLRLQHQRGKLREVTTAVSGLLVAMQSFGNKGG